MYTVYIRDTSGMFNLFGTAATRREWVLLRQNAGAVCKSRGLNGQAVSGYTPNGEIKLGIHGYK